MINFLCRLMVATSLALGFGTLWFVLITLIGGETLESWQEPADWPDREEFVVGADGTPLIRSTPRGSLVSAYRQLDGREVAETDNLTLLQPAWLDIGGHTPRWDLFDLLLDGRLSVANWSHRLRLFVDNSRPELYWFFVHDGRTRGTGYFVAYDRTQKRPAGYIGTSGFSADALTPEDWFPVTFNAGNLLQIWSSAEMETSTGQWREGPFAKRIPSRLVYVSSGRRLYLVDLSARSVKTIFEAPAEIRSFAPLDLGLRAAESEPTSPLGVVRTRDSIHVLDGGGGLLMSFPIPSVDQENLLLLYAPPRRPFFAEFYQRRICDADRNVDPRVVYRIAADGSVVDRTTLFLDSGMLKWHRQPTATVFRWALPAPAVLPLVESCMIAFIDGESDLRAAARAMLRDSWPSLLGVLGFSSLLAAASWRRARASALPLPEQAAWAAFVLLTGLPGYAGFRLHRTWPVRRPCPRCEARVPWDRGECAACGAPFPTVLPTGIEVFC